MTNSIESNMKQLPIEVARALDLLRHPSVTGFATRVGEGFATGIANSMRSTESKSRSLNALPRQNSFMNLFTRNPKDNINAMIGPQKIENDGWKGIVEVLVMSLSTEKGKELAISVTKAFTKELMRSWLEQDEQGAFDRDGRLTQHRKVVKIPHVLRDSSNFRIMEDSGNNNVGSFPLKGNGHAVSNRIQSSNFTMCASSTVEENKSTVRKSNKYMTLPMLAFELATSE